MSRHTTGSLLIAACALSWGVIPVIVREVPMPPLTLVAFRVLLSAVSVGLVMLLIGRRDLLRPPPLPVLALGVLLGVHWSFFFAALRETSVATAVVVTYSAPIMMAILAPLLIGERVPRITIGALAVSAAGIATITVVGGEGGGAVRPTGIALALMAAITMALLIVLLKRYAADVDPRTVAIYEDGVAAIMLSPALFIPEYSLGGEVIAYLLLLSAVLTGFVGIVYVAALRWVPATTTGILMYMEPVSAAVIAALLLGEPLTAAVLAGGAAIVAAGIVVILRSPDPVVGSAEDPVPAGSPAHAKA